MKNLPKLYQNRFSKDLEFRQKGWKVLCDSFFQKYVSKEDTVLEIACGYCEFINNIGAKKKIGVDINPDAKKFAAKDVKIILTESTNLKGISDTSIDVVFISNFFEHITKDEILKTLKEARRVLKNKGKILILQPNIRFAYKEYWNFFDHITPIDDKSLLEVLQSNGFEVLEIRPKFLPFSSKTKLPKILFLLKIYLKVRPLQYLMGKQAFVYAKKSNR